jgi:WD40 repeat protein
VWSGADERLLLDYKLPAPAHCLALSPDGAWLAVGFSEEGLLLIGVASGEALARVTYADYNANCVRGVAFSPDGSLLAAASLDGGLRLWKTETLAAGGSTRAWRALHEHEGGLTAVTFSADGTLLATASHDGTARLWGIRG